MSDIYITELTNEDLLCIDGGVNAYRIITGVAELAGAGVLGYVAVATSPNVLLAGSAGTSALSLAVSGVTNIYKGIVSK